MVYNWAIINGFKVHTLYYFTMELIECFRFSRYIGSKPAELPAFFPKQYKHLNIYQMFWALSVCFTACLSSRLPNFKRGVILVYNRTSINWFILDVTVIHHGVLPIAWGFAGWLGIKSAGPPAKFQKPYTFTLLQSVFQDSKKSALWNVLGTFLTRCPRCVICIDTGNGLMPSGTKPLPETMMH